MSYKTIVEQITTLAGEDSKQKTNKIYLLGLLPMLLMSALFFGLESFRISGIAVITCLIFEYLFQRFILKNPSSLRDGSAVIMGVLVALTLPTGLPGWLIVLGSLLAIGISRSASFRSDIRTFNPILVSWMLLRVSFPSQMTTWSTNITSIDSITGATPLGLVKEGLKNGKLMTDILADSRIPGYFDLFWGNMSGSMGEISAIAILLGGIYLIWKRLITWHIPFAVLGTFFILEGFLWMAAPGSFLNPVFHLLTGGLMLGALFLATEPFTSPSSPTGKLLYGAGIGLITLIIRNFTSLPEGIALAILVMNGLSPLIRKKFPVR